MCPVFRQLLRSAVRSRRRLALALLVTLFGGYGVTYAVVEFRPSPAVDRVDVGGGRHLAYLRSEGADPDGPDLVLVHGTPANVRSWTPLRERATRSPVGNVYAIDRLGFGGSTPGTFDRLADHAASIGMFIDTLDLDRPILVGHSYGGPVVLQAAADLGDRIGGVVILAGGCDPEMDDPKWLRGAVERVSPVLPTSWGVANRELLALNRENRSLAAQLDSIRCPVVVVHGRWDPVCPHDETVSYLESALVGADSVRVVSLSRRGHNVHRGDLDQVVAAIEDLASGQ